MMVQIMLEGDVSKSWLAGDNSQILPTETQKNTCYAIALKADFDCIELYGLALARDILQRHAHIKTVTLDMTERLWDRVMVGGKPHNHVFSAPVDQTKRTCHLVMQRGREDAASLTSGMCDIKLMKTAQSGFAGYIKDEYTNLQPVGGATSTIKDRIMCTLLEASWDYSSIPSVGFPATNAAVFELLVELFAGPADRGVFSKSVQETAYNMCVAVLRKFPEISAVTLITPNIHHYVYPLDPFGLSNPTSSGDRSCMALQATDCNTTASGRIETRVSRPGAHL